MIDNTHPKVRFTWNISYDCNYRCSYCFFNGKWEEYRKRNTYLSVDEWMKYWNAIYEKHGKIFLVITGGEPFIYPNFINLIKRLSKICFHINISTNSSMNLSKFIQEIDPKNVSVSLSFQREFDTIDSFIERVKLVRKYNFKGCLNLVAYPPFLANLQGDKDKLKSETGEEFKIIPFFGSYKDVKYPEGYNQEERKLIGIDDAWFDKVQKRGDLCSAGHTSALIFPDGKVSRCGQIGEKLIIGNLFDPGFDLLDGSMTCDTEYCPCQEYSIEGNSQKEDVSLNEDAPVVDSRIKLSSTDKIKFAWDIHYRCNFRCPYCWFYKEWAKMSIRNLDLSPDEWMVHWKRIYDRYGEVKIEIVGGEPFVYPNFIELVRKLSDMHLVKITTNLSGNIERFVKQISPKRVDLDLNYHMLFIDLDTVMKKAKILNDAGFKSGICFLAYPPQMGHIDRLSKVFRQAGINFALAAFWGEHEGKKYPDAYTQEERDMMRPYLGDVNRLSYHLNANSPKGKLCKAGCKYADIQADGNVVRCSPLGNKSIGNITDEGFRLLENPSPCEAETCSSNEYDNLVEA